jgi:hypothetical protein
MFIYIRVKLAEYLPRATILASATLANLLL